MHSLKLGQYKGLNIIPEPKFSNEELDIAVKETLYNIFQQWTKKNKPADKGDEVVISVNAQCNGQYIPELSMSDFRYTVGDPKLLAEFNNVLGKKEEDHFEMDITISPQNPVERVSGKLVHFKGIIQEILPLKVNINDDIVKQINPTITSVKQLKSKLRKTITASGLLLIRENNLKSIFNAIIAKATYELNQDELNKVFKETVETTKQNFIQDKDFANLLPSEGFDTHFYDDCMSIAKTTILEKLVIDEIIKIEKIKLSDETLAKKKVKYLKEMNENQEMFQQIFPSKKDFYNKLLIDKVYDLLLKWNLAK